MTPNPRFLYLSRKHEEALLNLSYGIEKRKGFVMITGEIGTGKTTLCRALLNRLKEVDSALVLNPAITESGILTAIVEDFGISSGRSIREKINSLNIFLLEQRKKGRNAVVIIDESQHLSAKAMEMVRLLSNLETENEKLLQIVFMGQPELRAKLESSELRQLNQRIAVRYHLNPLNYTETCEYVLHRLRIAGCPENSLKFTEGANRQIFDYSSGYPRLINALGDRTLMTAYIENARVIGKGTVIKAIRDLSGTGAAPDSRLLRWVRNILGRNGVRA